MFPSSDLLKVLNAAENSIMMVVVLICSQGIKVKVSVVVPFQFDA